MLLTLLSGDKIWHQGLKVDWNVESEWKIFKNLIHINIKSLLPEDVEIRNIAKWSNTTGIIMYKISYSILYTKAIIDKCNL